MTSMMSSLDSRLRQLRMARGLTQSDLARRAGISRQALSAIEAGSYLPSVAVALGIARALGESVERLFGGAEDEARHVAADWAPAGPRPAEPGRMPVALARIGGRLVAESQPTARLTLVPAAGRIESVRRRQAEIASFRSDEEIDATILVAGCDPAAALLADWLGRRHPPVTVAVLQRSSRAALAALKAGRAHVAGVHLRDPGGTGFNLDAVARQLDGFRAVLVTFAEWELGLATAPGNPLAIRSAADLARPGLRLVNREPGAGARLALDEALAQLSLPAARLIGYARELGGHLEIAAAIAAGAADAGMTLRVAAEAYGLGFVALRQERYDLVVAEAELDTPPVRAMLDALASRRFAREVGALCTYDTSRMGEIVARSG